MIFIKKTIDAHNFITFIHPSILQIPFIKLAQSVHGNKPIKLYASPWTAPAWMKSNGELTGQGYLLPEYYSTWANYFIKFLDHYKEHEVEFWGLTAQNEPWNGLVPNFPFNAMGWNASMQREWIINHLGPRLYIFWVDYCSSFRSFAC